MMRSVRDPLDGASPDEAVPEEFVPEIAREELVLAISGVPPDEPTRHPEAKANRTREP